MTLIASQIRRLATFALVAALAVVAVPVSAHAEAEALAEAVTVTGIVESGADGSIAIVSEEGGRFVIVAPASTSEAIRSAAGKTVNAKGTVAKNDAGQQTLTVTTFEVVEG